MIEINGRRRVTKDITWDHSSSHCSISCFIAIGEEILDNYFDNTNYSDYNYSIIDFDTDYHSSYCHLADYTSTNVTTSTSSNYDS